MLTGTPLQNDLEELQNLLQFILPDVFSKEDINESADLQVCTSLLLLPLVVAVASHGAEAVMAASIFFLAPWLPSTAVIKHCSEDMYVDVRRTHPSCRCHDCTSKPY